MTRKKYSPEFKAMLVDLVAKARGNVPLVAAERGVEVRLLRKWVALAATRPSLEPVRPGPKPALPPEAEQRIREWIIARQQCCQPVTRDDIIRKASSIAELVCGKSLGEGWYARFMARFPDLAVRKAQILTKARGSIVDVDLMTLFNTLMLLIVNYRLDASRVFNVDETAFSKKKDSKQVVALRGSKEVWALEPAVNFHLSIVACASAAGFVVPPTFIVPGETVGVDLLSDCDIEGAAVTTSPTGFMNMELFRAWLRFFSKSVPASIKRPVLLVMDGCSSHYSPDIVQEAADLKILLVLLPSNVTHLLQPLDVAVFAPLKSKLKRLISELMEDDGYGNYTIDKKTAIKLVSLAWFRSPLGSCARAGFRACGIFPLSLVNMERRLDRFKYNGTHQMQPYWILMQDHVEQEVLKLPPPKMQTRSRKTTKVAGRLLTRELLEAVAAEKTNKRKKVAAPKVNGPKTKKPKPGTKKQKTACETVAEAVAE